MSSQAVASDGPQFAVDRPTQEQHKEERHAAGFAAIRFGVSVADATIITIDANNYSAGTDLSHIDANVTLSSLVQPPPHGGEEAVYAPIRSAVLVQQTGFGVNAKTIGGAYSHMFEYEECVRSGHGCYVNIRARELSFVDPVGFINIEGYFHVDGPWMIAYDALGNVVGRCRESNPTDPCSTRVTRRNADYVSVSLQAEHQNISRVVYGSWSADGYAALVRYSVPEPGTLALLTVGLLGVGAMRRRRPV